MNDTSYQWNMHHLRHTRRRPAPSSNYFYSNTTNQSSSSSSISTTLDFSLYDHHLLHNSNTLRKLQQVHCALSTTGFFHHRHLLARLILKYSNIGYLNDARCLFNELPNPPSFLWNTIIRASSPTTTNRNDMKIEQDAIKLYILMRQSGVLPNNYTYPFVLRACGVKSLGFSGKCVHCDVIKTGFESDSYVEASLVDMYGKCEEIRDGRKVFDGMTDRDLVCWTSMITAYERVEMADEALRLFVGLQEEDGLVADRVTLISVSSAVGKLGNQRMAQSVHCHMLRKGFFDEVEASNAVIGMYAKCGDFKLARSAFDVLEQRDEISWNSMMSGYVQNGNANEALSLLRQMQVIGPKIGAVTALIAVIACAYLGPLHLARQLHGFITTNRMVVDTKLSNAIIDMYAKCGNLPLAARLFNERLKGNMDVNSWNVMISAYGMHGQGREALKLFHQMQDKGVEPDHITLTSVLSACSHSGLVEEGKEIFNGMRMKPLAKHYACLIDLLGRAGRLKEAYEMIKNMPVEPNDAVWGSLLGSCRIHWNKELAEVAAKKLFRLEPEHSGYYILMSNVYAVSSKWAEVGKMRERIKTIGLKKPVAYSMIELGTKIHRFRTAERSHPEFEEVYRWVEELIIEMKMAGYVADGNCVLHDVEDEDKEIILSHHSEKLAVAYGLIKSAGKKKTSPLRVVKNLRICNDCHSAFKCLSAIYQREIVVRDTNRFHHFVEGSCSCNDYW